MSRIDPRGFDGILRGNADIGPALTLDPDAHDDGLLNHELREQIAEYRFNLMRTPKPDAPGAMC